MLFACHELGLRVPEDVAVTGCDGTEHSAYSVLPLRTIRQPLEDLAARAVALATDEASDNPHETVSFELVIRESCGPHA